MTSINHKCQSTSNKPQMQNGKQLILILVCLILLSVFFPRKLPTTPAVGKPNQQPQNAAERVNAAIVMLARNSDLKDVLHSIQEWERSFNQQFQYPYVFLNDVPFTTEFKDKVSSLLQWRHVEFGTIPPEQWGYPPKINVTIADEYRKVMEQRGIIYGGSVSYRHMCRFFSGFIHKHPLVRKYDYMMRLEPDVDFYCDIDYDIFKFMRDNEKVYAFNMLPKEIPETIPSLFPLVLHFAKFRQVNSTFLRFFMDPRTMDYNMCHAWTNFHVVKLSFMQSDEYEDFWDYLDAWGGTHYERWGDAPIVSLAVGLFLNKSQVHFFNDIGYRHSSMARCPRDKSKCDCPWNANFDDSPFSCLRAFQHYQETPLFPN